VPRIGGTAATEVFLRFGQAQDAVWASTDDVGIVVVLTVVFPPADGAQLETAPLCQGPKFAAWALIQSAIARWAFINVGERHRLIPPNTGMSLCFAYIQCFSSTWSMAALATAWPTPEPAPVITAVFINLG
jgi:hypothetical protein